MKANEVTHHHTRVGGGTSSGRPPRHGPGPARTRRSPLGPWYQRIHRETSRLTGSNNGWYPRITGIIPATGRDRSTAAETLRQLYGRRRSPERTWLDGSARSELPVRQLVTLVARRRRSDQSPSS